MVKVNFVMHLPAHCVMTPEAPSGCKYSVPTYPPKCSDRPEKGRHAIHPKSHVKLNRCMYTLLGGLRAVQTCTAVVQETGGGRGGARYPSPHLGSGPGKGAWRRPRTAARGCAQATESSGGAGPVAGHARPPSSVPASVLLQGFVAVSSIYGNPCAPCTVFINPCILSTVTGDKLSSSLEQENPKPYPIPQPYPKVVR